MPAPRLADRLGLGEVWVKNDAANPAHSFKNRVVAGALDPIEIGPTLDAFTAAFAPAPTN